MKLWCFLSLAAVLSLPLHAVKTVVEIGEVKVSYFGDGPIALDAAISNTGADITLTIGSTGNRERLFVRALKPGQGVSVPYRFTVVSPSNALSAVVVNLGKGQTGSLCLTAGRISQIITKQAHLSVTSTATRIHSIAAGPGLSCLFAPKAKVHRVNARSYIGNEEFFNLPVTNFMPEFRVQVWGAGTLKTVRRDPQWISQVYAEDAIRKIRTRSASHIAVGRKLGMLKCTNLTGFVQVGVTITNGATASYNRARLRHLKAGVVYDCAILGGVPFLTNPTGTNTYYDTVPALGRIGRMKSRSTLRTLIVSRKKIHFAKRKKNRPLWGNGTEIWEREKERKLKIYP
ncbi:hypothetical protein GX586_10005 [bacterium]|nr:hypothetical protein [bacterium]